jgi:hypothetical protein
MSELRLSNPDVDRARVSRLWSQLGPRKSARAAADAVRSRELVIENAVLRHQVNVLQRRSERPTLQRRSSSVGIDPSKPIDVDESTITWVGGRAPPARKRRRPSQDLVGSLQLAFPRSSCLRRSRWALVSPARMVARVVSTSCGKPAFASVDRGRAPPRPRSGGYRRFGRGRSAPVCSSVGSFPRTSSLSGRRPAIHRHGHAAEGEGASTASTRSVGSTSIGSSRPGFRPPCPPCPPSCSRCS